MGYVVEHVLPAALRAIEATLLFGSTEEWLEDLAPAEAGAPLTDFRAVFGTAPAVTADAPGAST
jgi:hypothetical protein